MLPKTKNLILILIGLLGFSVLMGVHSQFVTFGARTVSSAIAFLFLGLTIASIFSMRK